MNAPIPSRQNDELLKGVLEDNLQDFPQFFYPDAGDRFDHIEAELLAMGNPFALVVLACQKALYEGKVPDAELGRDRLMIARELLRGGYDHGRVIGLLVFLKNFLYVRDPEINRTFEEELVNYSGGTITMGVIEVVRKQALQMERQMGWELGWQEGRAKAEEEKLAEKIASAMNFKKMGLSPADIAKGLGLPLEQVEGL